MLCAACAAPSLPAHRRRHIPEVLPAHRRCCTWLSLPQVFAGLLVGAMLPYWFSAMTMKSVGKVRL